MALFRDPDGPIERFEWGTFIIRGEEHSQPDEKRRGKGKDIRLIGKKATRWKERKGHRLTPDMITKVYGKDIEVLIIGTGAEGALECMDEVIAAIRENGIPKVIVAPTPEACRKYNKLFHEGKRVALLAHGTC